MILVVQYIFITIAIVILVSIYRGAPYVPSEAGRIKKIVEFAVVRPGMRIVDIGSGDGRVLIALARAGAEAHGYEINPLLILITRLKIRGAKLSDRAYVHWGDFWAKDFSGYDAAVVFGIGHIMEKLEKKLKAELRPGAHVVSNAFKFPGWNIEREEQNVRLYIKS